MNVSRTATLVAAANVGQLPTALRALLVVLLGHHNTGSYAVAGMGAAAAAVGLALTAPLFGRLLARWGHRRVLLATGAASLASHVALVGMQQPVLFVVAAGLAGLTSPPLQSSARALLPELVAPEDLGRAYAGNAVVQEMLYVAGPLWITLWMAATSAPGAVIASAIAGTGALAAAVVAVPARTRRAPIVPRTSSPLGEASMRTLLGVHLGYMTCMGAMWVLIPAFATEAGRPEQAPLLVTVWSLGSLAGGVVCTVGRASQRLPSPYLTLLGVLTAGAVPLVLPSTVPQMAGALAAFGLGLAPWLAVADELVARAAPRGSAGEAYGWLVTAGQIGSAAGSAMAGALADRQGAGPPFLIVSAALLATFTLAILRRSTLPSPDRTFHRSSSAMVRRSDTR